MLKAAALPGYREGRRRLMNRRAAKLIRAHSTAVLCPFERLPTSAQLALVQYMAIDGDAWGWEEMQVVEPYGFGRAALKAPDRYERDLKLFLPPFIRHYGREVFGYIDRCSMDTLTESVMGDEDMSTQFDTWVEYHTWYMQANEPDRRLNVLTPWPAILSSVPEETLQDGWHRFHVYASYGMWAIPVVWFPRCRMSLPKMAAAGLMRTDCRPRKERPR